MNHTTSLREPLIEGCPLYCILRYVVVCYRSSIKHNSLFKLGFALDRSEDPLKSPWKCLAPLIGIASGFGLGWILHLLLPRSSEATDIAARLLMLVYGLIGWAASILLNGKQLYCGGTVEMDYKARERYAFWAWIGLALLIVAAASLFRGMLRVYFPVIFTLISILVGEIGWGDPRRVFVLGR